MYIEISINNVVVQAQYQMHLAEMEAVKAGMPVVYVNHGGNENGPAIRDIHMENFTISVGGKDLIQDASVTLSFGRHYGQFLMDVNCTFYATFGLFSAVNL